ncbi:hypothetical protein ACSBR2_014896 [Camellia fascicularis]
MPLMKTLTFNIICSLIFGIERGTRRDALRGLCQNMIEGMLICNEDDSALLSDEEIEANAVIIMIGGYDTSSILLTFLIVLLANEPSIYAAIVQEQEEIAKSKTLGELLTWDDLTKMKYTWRVAMETLKDNPSWVLFLQEGTERYTVVTGQLKTLQGVSMDYSLTLQLYEHG